MPHEVFFLRQDERRNSKGSDLFESYFTTRSNLCIYFRQISICNTLLAWLQELPLLLHIKFEKRL